MAALKPPPTSSVCMSKPKLAALVEDQACVLDGLEKRLGIRSAGTDVESHAHDFQAEVLGQAKQCGRVVERGAELLAQSAQARRVVSQNAQKEVGVGKELLGLVELVGIVKRHLADAVLCGVAHVRLGFAGLSIDDARRVDAQVQDLFNLGFGRTVKAGAESSQQAQNGRIGVALDGWGQVRAGWATKKKKKRGGGGGGGGGGTP